MEQLLAIIVFAILAMVALVGYRSTERSAVERARGARRGDDPLSGSVER